MNRILASGFTYFVTIQAALAGSLDTAFERMNNFVQQEWSYQKTSVAKEHTVEHYDPRNKPMWTLLTLDNKPPSEKQIKSYLSRKAEQNKKAEEKHGKNRGRLNLHEIINTESLTLIEQGTETDKYAFQPIIEEGNFSDSLSGELWHNKKNNYIEQFRFHNINTFSPMLGVKINKMHTSFKFKEISKDTFAPIRISVEVVGKAFGVKKINDKELQTYQSYKPIINK